MFIFVRWLELAITASESLERSFRTPLDDDINQESRNQNSMYDKVFVTFHSARCTTCWASYSWKICRDTVRYLRKGGRVCQWTPVDSASEESITQTPAPPESPFLWINLQFRRRAEMELEFVFELLVALLMSPARLKHLAPESMLRWVRTAVRILFVRSEPKS